MLIHQHCLVEDKVVKEDGSVALEIDATLHDPSVETLTVTITGIPTDWDVTDLDGGFFDAPSGTWWITLPAGENFSGGPTLEPPADSDADISPDLTVTATATQPGAMPSAVDAPLKVTTDAVIDAPELTTSDATGTEDTPIPLDITAAATDTDGSEAITNVLISDVPAGATLSAGIDLGGGVWQLTHAELTGLEITPPQDFSGTFDLTVAVTAEEVTLSGDEIDFTDNSMTITDTLTIDVSAVADEPTLTVKDALVKEDSSVALEIEAAPGDIDGSESLTVTIENIPTGWTMTDLDGGTFDATTGIWTITMPAGQSFSGGPTMAPPADSDVDISSLTVTATSTEPNGDAKSIDAPLEVVVDAVIDAPTLAANDASGAEDTAIALDITTAATDTDGSEAITNIIIGGVPTGATLSAGTDLGGGVWQLTTANLVGLEITPPQDFSGTFDLTVAVTAEEVALNGTEVDFTDNSLTVTDTLTIDVTPVADEPTLNRKRCSYQRGYLCNT